MSVIVAAFFFLQQAASPLSAPAPALAMSKKAPAVQDAASTSQGGDSETVWVGKSDDAKSCAKDRGIPLEQMEATLETNGIKVMGRKKVPDGNMRIQMCGADKGDMNGYQISRKDLAKAKDLGFKPVNGNF